MVSKLISILAVLSLFIRFVASESVDENLQTNLNTFVLVNPKQVPRLEKTIQRFLSKIAKPVDKPIVLRCISSESNGLVSTIRQICESIRGKLMEFAENFGLHNNFQRYEQSSNDYPLAEDWYSETLLQSILMVRDLGDIINEVGSSIDLYFGEGNTTLQRNKQINSFKFLGVVYDSAEFCEKLAQCLLEMSNATMRKSSFNLSRSILNLIKEPPEVALKTLRFNINNVSHNDTIKNRDRQKAWHVFLCLAMISNVEINFHDCIRDLQHLEACLDSVKQRSTGKMYNADVKSWTRAIQRLSDREIRTDKYGEVEISCKTARRMPRRTKRRTKLVLERILNKNISKESPFHRAVNDLADTLSKSEWGRKFVDELYEYTNVYEEGRKKLMRSSKFADKDEKAMTRYGEVLESLKTYKSGMLLQTLGAINRMHRSAINFENFFAQGMKDMLHEAWQGHVKVMSSLMGWITKLLELHMSNGKEPNSPETLNSDEDSSFEDEQKVAITYSRSDIEQDVDRSMNGLMESMNRLSRHQGVNNNTTLACIANSLMLITMFMETVGFVSSIYCFEEAAIEQISMEYEDQWNRTRRSLLPLDYDQIVNISYQDYLLLELYENSTELQGN